jgi:type IV pilus assembly protein PilE
MRQKITKQKGVTLIELMIVVSIVAIVTAIAIPSYRTYVERTYTTEAFNSLSTYQLQMQQFFQDAGTYGAGNCGVAMAGSKHFNYACVLAGQGFLITATSNGVDNLNGYSFTIDDANNQVTTAYPTAAVPAACWLTKAGGC